MSRLRIIAAVGLAGLLFCGCLLAPAASQHRAQHADGDAHPDTCFLCLVAQGKLDQPQPVEETVNRRAVLLAAAAVEFTSACSAPARLQPPGRAPPSPQLSSAG